MSSKKIFAASMAAVLATGAVASYAMAAADDEVVISGVGLGEKQRKSATLSIKSTTDNMAGDIMKVTSKTDQTLNAYNNIRVGLWEALEDFKITDMKGAVLGVSFGAAVNYETNPMVDGGGIEGMSVSTKYGKVPAVVLGDGTEVFVGITVAPDTGAISAAWVDKDGNATTGPTGFTLPDPTDGTAGAVTEDEMKAAVKEVADYLWAKESHNPWGTNDGLATKTVDAWGQADLTNSWRKAQAQPNGTDTWAPGTGAGATKGSTCGPVDIKDIKFTLGTGERLATNFTDGTTPADLLWGNWTLSGDITVSGDTYTKYVENKYGVNGAYDWTNTGWSDRGASFVYTDNGTTYIGLAVVAQTITSGRTGLCGLQLPDDLTKEPVVDEAKGDLNLKQAGSINLFYGGPVNPEVLQKLNEGGTVTFELKEEIPADQYVLGNLEFWGGHNNFFIDVAHKYTLSGNKVTFDFPAGLTRHDGDKDPWGDFIMTWDIKVRGLGSGLGSAFEGGSEPEGTEWDSSIISITFKADGSSNGDANKPSIDNGESNNSGNNGGNTSNPGSTSGNPNTGIALAVAPVVLAAGAVVTLVSKKRK